MITDIFTFSKVPSSVESVNSSFAFLDSGYHICHELSIHWISLSILMHVFQIRTQSSVDCWRCFQSTARLIANFLYLTMFLHDIVYITPLSFNTSSRISQFELFKTTWVWFLTLQSLTHAYITEIICIPVSLLPQLYAQCLVKTVRTMAWTTETLCCSRSFLEQPAG